MLLNTVFTAFVLGFVVIATIGHILVLQAFLRKEPEASPPARRHHVPEARELSCHPPATAPNRQAA